MKGRINVIADDYGLSDGIGSAVRDLIEHGKITGTSCMTIFPEWNDQAALLRKMPMSSRADIGLHLTLTDFAAISRPTEAWTMPPLGRLIARSYLGRLDQATIDAELDAQLQRFVEGMGRLPDFIDGHQHIHFLPTVRSWLETRRERLRLADRLPWLRGAPKFRAGNSRAIRAKIALVSLIAAGFDRRMAAAGFSVRGPLVGFYDWKRPSGFRSVMGQLEEGLPDGSVVMCHPGLVDPVLVNRDRMIEARPVEFQALARTSGFRELDLCRASGSRFEP